MLSFKSKQKVDINDIFHHILHASTYMTGQTGNIEYWMLYYNATNYAWQFSIQIDEKQQLNFQLRRFINNIQLIVVKVNLWINLFACKYDIYVSIFAWLFGWKLLRYNAIQK